LILKSKALTIFTGNLDMNRKSTPPHRVRPVAQYAPGTVRYRKWHCNADIRLYRPPKGWMARADELGYHPITGRLLPEDEAHWWIQETYIGSDNDI